MHCTNCGTVIPQGARFCAACGAPVADPELTQPRRHSSSLAARSAAVEEVERIIFKTRPTLLFIAMGYVIAALAAVLLVSGLAYLGVSAFISLIIGLALLLVPACYHIRRNTISYTLTDSRIEIARGTIVRTTRNIPLEKVQDVTVSATIFQRLLGFGDLVIDNASEQGGATVLHNIPKPSQHAELLLRELRR